MSDNDSKPTLPQRLFGPDAPSPQPHSLTFKLWEIALLIFVSIVLGMSGVGHVADFVYERTGSIPPSGMILGSTGHLIVVLVCVALIFILMRRAK